MRRAALLILAVLLPLEVWAVETTPRDLVVDPTRFAGQVVTFRGTIAQRELLATDRGTRLTRLEVAGGAAFIQVFTVAPPPCFVGSMVRVEGRFETIRQVEHRVFHNVVDALWVRCE